MGVIERLRGMFGAQPAKPRPDATYFRENRSPFLSSWKPALREQHEEVRHAWNLAATRAIDSLQNSGFISGLIEQHVAMVVGTGLQMSMRPDFKDLGWTEEQSNDWSADVEDRWLEWCQDPMACDLQGRMSFDQMQQLAMASWMSYGEVLALLPLRTRRDGSMTKVLMLPPSRLRETSTGTGVIHGVRVDADGMATSYLFRQRDHAYDGMEREIEIRRFDGDMRQQVVHVYEPTLASTRGISPLAPVLKVVRQIDQYQDATLTAALIQTIFAATIKTDLSGISAFEGLMTESDQMSLNGLAAAKGDWYDASKIDLFTHGRIAHLFPNDTLEFHKAEAPGTQYEAFMAWLMREVARCVGLTYESASGDYRGATYSSIRMASADSFQIALKRRQNISIPFARQVKATWLEDEIGAGRIAFPGGIEGFLRFRPQILRDRWTGPPKPQADDLKTARAQQTLLSMGITSLQTVCVEYGTDWKAEMEQRKRETDLATKLGLPNPHPFPETQMGGRDEQGSAEDKTDDPSYMPA